MFVCSFHDECQFVSGVDTHKHVALCEDHTHPQMSESRFSCPLLLLFSEYRRWHTHFWEGTGWSKLKNDLAAFVLTSATRKPIDVSPLHRSHLWYSGLENTLNRHLPLPECHCCCGFVGLSSRDDRHDCTRPKLRHQGTLRHCRCGVHSMANGMYTTCAKWDCGSCAGPFLFLRQEKPDALTAYRLSYSRFDTILRNVSGLIFLFSLNSYKFSLNRSRWCLENTKRDLGAVVWGT